MPLSQILSLVSLALNFLLVPVFAYVIRIEGRLTRLETQMEHMPKRQGDLQHG